MEEAKPVNVAERIGDWRISNEAHQNGKREEYRSHRMGAKNLEITQRWAGRWINNAAINLPVMRRAPGLDILRGAARGLPVICVGIGPSLDDFLPLVEDVSRKCIILATDAAVAPLLAHNVEPDLIVNYDCRDEQQTLWQRIAGAPRAENFVLLANSCASPEQLAIWPGKLMGFNMAQGDDEFISNVLPTLYPELGSLPNLGTVGNSLVVLADLMGAGRIFVVGYDFCYGGPNENRYRCQDYTWHPAELDLPAGFRPLDNDVLYKNGDRLQIANEVEEKGKKFLTDDALWNYRRMFLETVGTLDLPVVNVGGRSLEGFMDSMSLPDFMATMNRLERLQVGHSIIPHLAVILQGDPRDGLRWDPAQRLWRDIPLPPLPPQPTIKEITEVK